MALNGKHHFEEACEGAKLVAHELRKYARICAQYLKKSTTGREDLRDSIIGAYVSLLRYCAELRSLGDGSVLGKPSHILWCLVSLCVDMCIVNLSRATPTES
jgi:hypothetical protein